MLRCSILVVNTYAAQVASKVIGLLLILFCLLCSLYVNGAETPQYTVKIKQDDGRLYLKIKLYSKERIKVEYSESDGNIITFIGSNEKNKRIYVERNANQTNPIFKVKRGDNGFKLRSLLGENLFKIKIKPKNLKVVNEHNGVVYQIKDKNQKIKVYHNDYLLGKIQRSDDRIKIKDASNTTRYKIKDSVVMMAYGVLLLDLPMDVQASLLGELMIQGY